MAARAQALEVKVGKGRSLEALVDDRSSGRPLVFHWGTPGSAVWFQQLADIAAAAGLRLITYSRPGYDGSSPSPGRSVADAAVDVDAILAALDQSEYVTLGWSGGGPHALACAARSPARCLAAATIASIAPYRAGGLDWLSGMGAENVEEYSAALEGEPALRPLLVKFGEELKTIRGPDVAASLGTLVSDVDKRALTGEFAELLATSFRQAVSTGIEGWLEDDLAFVKDWGFQPDRISVPVSIWQGEQDRMVPFAHGQWLAGHMPTARAQLYPEHGHLSLPAASLEQIVGDLASLPAHAEAR
jgi:pimeloyl-ACP methyl ester carboxylesterase